MPSTSSRPANCAAASQRFNNYPLLLRTKRHYNYQKYSHSRRQTRIHWPDQAIHGRWWHQFQMQLQISSSIEYYKTFRTVLGRGKGTVEYTPTLYFHQFNAAFTVWTSNNTSQGSKWWSKTLPLAFWLGASRFRHAGCRMAPCQCFASLFCLYAQIWSSIQLRAGTTMPRLERSRQ